jgi:hypothetical protein
MQKKIDRIKTDIAYFLLNKKIKSNNRSVKVSNFEKASHIGIIFNAINEDIFEIVKNFANNLIKNNKNVNTLGYIDEKEIKDHFLIRQGYDFISRDNLNWYFKPIAPAVDKFMELKLDILINLSLIEYFPIKYIVALSKASFKIGKKMEDNNYTDLMIDMDNEFKGKNIKKDIIIGNGRNISASEYRDQLEFLISQINHYVPILNPV